MVNVNTGEQNKVHGGGRSILDYSLIACFTLVLLLGLLVLDAFEYISVPGLGGAKGSTHTAIEAAADIEILSKEDLVELQKQIADAKEVLNEKKAEVERLVNNVEDELRHEDGTDEKVETPEEKKQEEEKKEAVVEAVVENELGLDRFCGVCQYGHMPFTCFKRLDWMMTSYGLTEDVAKRAIINKCHARLRG